MSHEDLRAELEQLRKENAAFRKEFASRINLKVSEKGAVSVYGIRRVPVTLYKEEWLKLLDRSSDIRAFIAANKAQLKAKDRLFFPARFTEASSHGTAVLPAAQQSYAAKPWLVVRAVKILTINEVVYTSLAYRQPGEVNRASSILYSAGLVPIPTSVVHSMPRDKSVGAA